MINNLELEKRISTTNDAGLMAILLEKLIDNFNECKITVKDNKSSKINELMNHSRAILTELLVQFNGDDEISSTLRELNVYINKQMTLGQIKKDTSMFDNCIRILKPICEGFQQLEVKEKPKAVTGLTYGKNNLDEHTIDGSRSFKG